MEESAQESDVFMLLAKPIRAGLIDLGFSEPTLPQVMAIPPILEGNNVLLIAPTGTGKTEAVLLPIFSKFLENRTDKGMAVIYVTPLRALNRDMIKRLGYWATKLGIEIQVRHGDTSMKIRRKQAISPPDMLVTTPETLQAILPGTRMRQHLKNVRYVVIDEVHELASSKRGAQLSVALERLHEVTGAEFQRIGLSATIGNPEVVAHYVAGTKRQIKIVQAVLPKSFRYHVEYPVPVEPDYDLAAQLNTSPEAAARIRRISNLVDSHKSTLIFVNSRQNAEMLGFKISQLGRTDIAVHHGSLSREERAQIEDEFKAGNLKAIICTSTLELGIDIGDVDFVVQYLSPRQVSSLVQRVGRSGHRLDRLSEGVIITAYPDDTLESLAAIRNAYEGKIEPVIIHENALDVLAHQVVGLLMDKGVISTKELSSILRRAYPFRSLKEETLFDVLHFLHSLNEVKLDPEVKMLTKARKTRTYYFENLSMIPDERRYPLINVINDRKIGTLGDEFMALHARVGLNIIVRGRVWRIVQIEEETGTVYIIPSEDPLAAIPGWDGEILPVPFDLAKRTGELRRRIQETLKQTGNAEATAAKLAEKMATSRETLDVSVKEVEEHLKQGAPLPTDERIVVEAYDKYLIIHASFGEMVNRTLGGVFDSLLSDRETIIGWWNDGYRILIEAPGKITPKVLEDTAKTLFSLDEEKVDNAFKDYLDSKFPFSYKMKFVADRFGALPRGKTMGEERLGQLPARFKDTPIYDETIREAMLEKADLPKAKEVMQQVRNGRIQIATVYRSEKPTPLAYHILAKYSDLSELMAPEETLVNNIDRMKGSIEARTVTLLCMNCGQWTRENKIRTMPEEPACSKCGSRLLAPLYPSQNVEQLHDNLIKRKAKQQIDEENLKTLTQARRTADLVLSYGKNAVIALEVKGVGPETASRILGKMHSKEEEFYMDLLKAKIQYLRTKPFWEDKEKRVQNVRYASS